MSASLIVLIPVVLLGLVTALCFVGCVLNTHGFGNVGPYQDAVSKTSSLIAFWHLSDLQQTTAAFDSAPKQPPLTPFTGTYVGNVFPGQMGIIPSDLVDTTQTCASFGGGFVQVNDFHPELNPQTSFSVECWVQVASIPSPPAVMMVVSSDDFNAVTGYQLHATLENTWGAAIGLGPGPNAQFLIAKPPMGSPPTVVAGVTTYLVATFDSTTNTLSVFVDGQLSAQKIIDPTTMPPFAPSVMPTPFTIGALSTTGSQQAQFPFSGKIQDVAFYGVALDPGVIQSRFMIGSTPPG
jgi:concanavalin A-like lectin/glucanase superfamily protein